MTKSATIHCSFCGRSRDEVKILIAGQEGHICENCIEHAHEIIDKELNTESSINKRDKIIIHTVKKGDTLIKIAKKYTTTVAEIQRINKLKTTTIQINQILKIK